jgi:hypothetical protein
MVDLGVGPAFLAPSRMHGTQLNAPFGLLDEVMHIWRFGNILSRHSISTENELHDLEPQS